MKIISTSHLQKKIGALSRDIKQVLYYIVLNKGKPKVIMLPYFDNCDKSIDEYLENYEISQNKLKIKKRMENSLSSGKSNLTI